jgi:hypothetical protein
MRAPFAVSAPGGTSASSMASGIGPTGLVWGIGPVRKRRIVGHGGCAQG